MTHHLYSNFPKSTGDSTTAPGQSQSQSLPPPTLKRSLQTRTFSSIYARWCKMTAFHGVLEFYSARNPLAKFLWFIILCLGFLLAANQSTELILNYVLEEKWATTITAEPPPNGRLKWPHISICKITQTELRTKDLNRRNLLDPYEVAYLDGDDFGVEFFNRYQARESLDEDGIRKKLEELRAKLNCTEMYPLCLQDTVIDCGGGAGRIIADVHCDCDQYSSQSSKPECFKINASAILRDKPPPSPNTVGYYSGLYLLLHPRIHETYPYLLQEDDFPPVGLRAEIYYDREMNQGSNTPIFLHPGSHTVIAMTAEKRRVKVRTRRTLAFQFTETPCVSKGVYKWYRTEVPSRHLCQNDCFVEFCAQYVNCTVNLSPSRSSIIEKECSDEQERNCSLARLHLHGRLSSSGFNVTECENECKEPCEHDFVTTKLTSSKFPSPTKVHALREHLHRALNNTDFGINFKNLTIDDMEQLILLNVFYESNEFRVVEKVNRASIDELISSIGGVIGVWTGISVITVLQALVYAVRGAELFFNRAFAYLNLRCLRAAELK